MNILENRIDSFSKNGTNWPYKNNSRYCHVENFAKAGFYFASKPKAPDMLRCFLCDIELSNWRPGQSPFLRHYTESPQCAWRCLRFPGVPASKLKRIKTVSSPKSEEMRSARLATFNKHQYWPPKNGSSNYPPVTDLVNAGFYFAPTTLYPSQVKCSNCELAVVVNSSNENLMRIHRDMSKDCPYFRRATRSTVPKKPSDYHDTATTHQTTALLANRPFKLPVITYGPTQYNYRLLARRNNAGTLNILPDLNKLIRCNPTQSSTLEQDASDSGTVTTADECKVIQPVTRRVLEGRAKKSSRKQSETDTDTRMPKKRNLTRTFTSDSASSSKELHLKVVVDNISKKRSSSPDNNS